MNRGAFAATDPVALHRLDCVRPIQQVEVVDQSIRVGGDAHLPLPHVALEDREVAAVAATIGSDFLVRNNSAQAWAPVDWRLADVRQPPSVEFLPPFAGRHCRPVARRRGARAGLELGDQLVDASRDLALRVEPRIEDLQEDPLRPAVVAGVGGGDAAPAIVTQPQSPQLTAIGLDVLGGRQRWVLPALHGELLGG